MDKDFDYLCSLLRNGEYTVKIVRKTKPRSISQNALMWMWYKCMEDSTGQRKEDFHDYYKAKFLTREIRLGRFRHPIRVVGSTKELNTDQFTKFLEQVKVDAAVEFGIALPLPEDKYYQSFVNEYKNQ